MLQSVREQWLNTFSTWAERQPALRAVLVVGSSARKDHPADGWSDLDLVVIATDPDVYLGSTDWFGDLGEPLFHIVERTSEGELIERRVLFGSGLDVDFMVASVERAKRGFPGTFIPIVMQRGWTILLDKDGLVPVLPAVPAPQGASALPSAPEFDEVVNDTWFHAAWCAKKLRRGELWKATICCDAYLKPLLLRMIEWHAAGERGLDTWYDGRFLEQWADPSVLQDLSETFARYRTEEVDGALWATLHLFHRLAKDVAARAGLLYPAPQADKVMDLIRSWSAPDMA